MKLHIMVAKPRMRLRPEPPGDSTTIAIRYLNIGDTSVVAMPIIHHNKHKLITWRDHVFPHMSLSLLTECGLCPHVITITVLEHKIIEW